VPSVIPTLVVQESTFLSKNILMGVDGRVIVNPEDKNYLLEHNKTHIRITIPIGAEGGKLKVSTNLDTLTHLRACTMEDVSKSRSFQIIPNRD